VNYDNSLVVTITGPCYSWASSSGDHLFTCGAIYRPPQSAIQLLPLSSALKLVFSPFCV